MLREHRLYVVIPIGIVPGAVVLLVLFRGDSSSGFVYPLG